LEQRENERKSDANKKAAGHGDLQRLLCLRHFLLYMVPVALSHGGQQAKIPPILPQYYLEHG
jgi:hypothetical protein